MSVHEPFEPSRAMGNEAVEKTESYGPGADRHVFENVKRSSEVTDLLAAARFAAQEAQDYGQQRVDELVAAVAGEFSRKSLADQLGRLTSEETGMGRWDHLSELLQRRILGTFADMRYETSVGSIGLDERLGTRIIARPVGVVAITTPATAPCSSVVANTLATLKTRNAAVFASNPRSLRSVSLTVEVIRTILEALDAPVDLVQATSGISRGQLEQLMAGADLVVAVGGARTVKRAYSSGTPAIGAGVGNATAIVDGTAMPE